MKNDYLNNKKKYDSNIKKEYKLKNEIFSVSLKSKNVDINSLLNRVKIIEKDQKKENFILLGWVCLVFSVTAIFLAL